MRILVVTSLYAPDECGGAQIISDLTVALQDRGHAVTVRCAYPHYPEWRDKSGQNGLRIRHEYHQGVKLERHGLYIPRRPSKLSARIFQEGSFLLSLARSLPRGQYDVALIYCPLMSAVAFGVLNRLVRRVPALLCVQDLPTDAAIAGGIMTTSSLSRLFNGSERRLFGQYAAWRTINPVMAAQLRRRGKQPICLIPDWIHPELEQALHMPAQRPDTNGQLQLLYSGNVGAKQGLPDFCKALARCQTDFHFRINGAGGGLDALRPVVAEDRRFVLGPLTPVDKFAQALRQTDLYVVTERPTGAPFFPSKTIPSMTVGTPILAVSNAHSPLGTEMRTYGLGPWLDWSQIGELDNLLGDITAERLASWRTAAVQRSEYYERTRCIDQFEAALVAVANHQPVADYERTRCIDQFEAALVAVANHQPVAVS